MWTPNELRKLIAQIAGTLFGIGGIVLIIQGVQATGKIDISSSLISGKIESGSAGLLLLFIAFFLIIIPTLFGNSTNYIPTQKSTSETNLKSVSLLRKIIIGLSIGIILTCALFIGGQVALEKKFESFANFLTFGGVALGVVTGIGLILSLIWFVTDYKSEENSKNNE